MHRIMNHDRAKISIGLGVFFFLRINVLPKWRHEYIGRSRPFWWRAVILYLMGMANETLKIYNYY